MSKPYERLTDDEKLLRLTHFPGKTGPRLERLLTALQHQLDSLVLDAGVLVKRAFQITSCHGDDLEQVGSFLDIARFAEENDSELRDRISIAASTFETVTKDAILDLFEGLIGKRPYFEEPFHTRLYQSGDVIDSDSGGEFTLMFDLPVTVMSEKIRVASGGTSVIVADETIVSPTTVAVSGTTAGSSDTTIYTSSVEGFPAYGEIAIEDEWVSYGSTQTSPAAFLTCVRGLYTTVPATHDIGTTVIEGCNKAFIEGTNEQVYNSQSSTTIFLSGGPYNWDTYFDVQYRITGSGIKDEFDEEHELAAAVDHMRAIGFDYKAAGIRANISVGLVLRSWFQANREVITITDSLSLLADEIHFPELFTWAATPARSVFYESEWDNANYHWDKTVWTQAYWDGEQWVRQGGTKDWYRLEITAHT